MGNAKFRGLPAPKPLGRFSKTFAWLATSGTPPHMQILGSIGWKGPCLRMREIVTPRRLFFSLFLGFMRLATGRPVGPIIAVNGSNDAPTWSSRPFYGFANKKNIFQYSYPKMWKIALRPTGNLNSYNFGTVEDTYKMFAPNRGFSGSANLMVLFKLTLNQPLLPCNRSLSLNTICPITRLVLKIRPRLLHQPGGFRGRRIWLCKWNLSKTNPCCHGKENLKILRENWL